MRKQLPGPGAGVGTTGRVGLDLGSQDMSDVTSTAFRGAVGVDGQWTHDSGRACPHASSVVRKDACRGARLLSTALQRRARSGPRAAGDPPAHVRYLGTCCAEQARARRSPRQCWLLGCWSRVTLIDPDRRRSLALWHGAFGRLKVDVALKPRNATARNIDVTTLPQSVHQRSARAPWTATSSSAVLAPKLRLAGTMIPVVDGGVAVEFDAANERLFSTHWRAVRHHISACDAEGNQPASDDVLHQGASAANHVFASDAALVESGGRCKRSSSRLDRSDGDARYLVGGVERTLA